MRTQPPVIRLLLISLIALASLRCSEQITRPNQPRPALPVPTQPAQPVWTGCGLGTTRVFDEAVPLYQPMLSRFILCGNGTFALEFIRGNPELFDYLGTFTQTDSTVEFSFSAFAQTTARRHGDSLSVKFSPAMNAADFVNGVYVLTSISESR